MGNTRAALSTGNGRSTSSVKWRTCRKRSPAIVAAMGGRLEPGPTREAHKAINPGGSVIHEVGGARMGRNAASAVTNALCETWDVKNLFLD